MSLLSRNTGGRRRVATMATVSVGTLLTYLVLAAVPAMAVSTCSLPTDIDPGAPVVNQVVVSVGVDDTVALRFAAGVLEKIDNPPANLLGAVWGPCAPAPVDVVRINGTDLGAETVRLVNGGDGADADGWGVGTRVTFVDGNNGNDTLEILTLAGASLGVEFGTSTAGTTVLDADWNVEAIGTDTADVQIVETETTRATGDTASTGVTDNILAGGDQNPSTIDITPAGAGAEDVTIPGTPGGAADTTGSDPAGNLQVPLQMTGGPGDDNLEPGNANDTVAGGAGDDAVVYGDAGAAVAVDVEAGTSTGGSGTDALSDVQSVSGSRFDDTLLGSSINNRLGGCDGNDVIDGRAGNDTIDGDLSLGALPPGLSTCAGPDGNDTLTGGAGNDTVSGAGGNDVIDEGAAASGADILSGGPNGPAGDTLNYSARTTATVVRAGAGAVSGQDANNDGDAADVGDENDSVGVDFETYITGSGNDTLVGVVGVSDETFVPGAGNDSVDGNGGTDMLDQSDAPGAVTFNLETGTSTGHGNDTFVEVETFASGAGDDIVIPDIQTGLPAGFDWFAGAGIDTIDGSTNTSGFAVDLSNLGGPTGCKAGPGAGLCTDVEDATGGSGNDTLTGSAISNVLIGGAGFDIISAGGGNDFVEGGAGNDTLTGGTGADFLSYVNAPSGEVIDLQLGFASGGDGDDAIGFFEIVLGSDFNDQITGGQGTTFDVNLRIRGRGGNDLITGSSSNDTLAGGGGNDVIRGSAGDDILRGAAGNDRLFGSSGDDFLFGGRGTDRGRGGPGDDICRGVEDRRSC
jgi:Ca2+-binding RTX toxin-like protein